MFDNIQHTYSVVLFDGTVVPTKSYCHRYGFMVVWGDTIEIQPMR